MKQQLLKHNSTDFTQFNQFVAYYCTNEKEMLSAFVAPDGSQVALWVMWLFTQYIGK